MCTKIVYQLDYNGDVIGSWKLPEGYENPIMRFAKELKQQKNRRDQARHAYIRHYPR